MGSGLRRSPAGTAACASVPPPGPGPLTRGAEPPRAPSGMSQTAHRGAERRPAQAREAAVAGLHGSTRACGWERQWRRRRRPPRERSVEGRVLVGGPSEKLVWPVGMVELRGGALRTRGWLWNGAKWVRRAPMVWGRGV